MEKIKVLDKHFKLYMSAEEIAKEVERVAMEMSRDLRDKKPIIFPVLNGSFVFAADLVRKLDFDAELSFLKYSSYSGTQTTGEVKKTLNFPKSVEGRHIVIVEDIIDTGLSIKSALTDLMKLKPSGVSVCTFFFKPDSFRMDYKVDYVGKRIANDFIVGYGMDYNEYGRFYKDVYVIDE